MTVSRTNETLASDVKVTLRPHAGEGCRAMPYEDPPTGTAPGPGRPDSSGYGSRGPHRQRAEAREPGGRYRSEPYLFEPRRAELQRPDAQRPDAQGLVTPEPVTQEPVTQEPVTQRP